MESMDKFWEPIVTWQFLISSLAIIAVITIIKNALRALDKNLVKRGSVKAVFALGDLLLGFVVAIPHDFLMGDTYTKRVFVGIVAGFFSQFIYHLILKRFALFGDANKGKPPAPSESGE